MNQFNPAKVIMLPTEKGNGSLARTPKNSLYRVTEHNRYLSDHIDQHLYIITDDKIENDDWYIITWRNEPIIQQCTSKEEEYSLEDRRDCKKIIATTDTSLKIIDESIGEPENWEYNMVQPSQQFIEQYIESYNKGKVITEVLVEYEYYFKGEDVSRETSLGKLLSIKINPKDNTINIKPIKDSWNREEVIYNVIKHRNDFLKFKTNSHYNPNDKEIKEWDNNWIKENL